jgi:hypothetical protein
MFHSNKPGVRKVSDSFIEKGVEDFVAEKKRDEIKELKEKERRGQAASVKGLDSVSSSYFD